MIFELQTFLLSTQYVPKVQEMLFSCVCVKEWFKEFKRAIGIHLLRSFVQYLLSFSSVFGPYQLLNAPLCSTAPEQVESKAMTSLRVKQL